jgi:hypothetical protein
MSVLGLSDRTTFYANYLNPALEAGLVERTIPDKPRSSKQKYRKVRKNAKRYVTVQLLVGPFTRFTHAANQTNKCKNGEGKLPLAFAALTRARLKPSSARYCALPDSSICLLVV